VLWLLVLKHIRNWSYAAGARGAGQSGVSIVHPAIATCWFRFLAGISPCLFARPRLLATDVGLYSAKNATAATCKDVRRVAFPTARPSAQH
jgi:hypothetical protein